jgi:glycerol-3-phosphate dehydrogenase
MFALPAGAHTIIGTTDTFTDVHPSDVRADESDVRYLLDSANSFFPDAKLTTRDVVAAWAGIRPLIAEGSDATEGSSSREHALQRSASGVLSITGGKLTTFRSMAAEVVDTVLSDLDADGTVTTHKLPLPGGDITSLTQESAAAAAVCGDEAVGAHLARAYGSRWRAVWALAQDDPELGARVAPGLPYTVVDFVWGVEREMACTLTDLLVRRTHIAFELADHGRSLAPRVARAVASRLGWSDGDVEREVARYERDSEGLFAIDPATRAADSASASVSR